jgi:hypothetical protein
MKKKQISVRSCRFPPANDPPTSSAPLLTLGFTPEPRAVDPLPKLGIVLTRFQLYYTTVAVGATAAVIGEPPVAPHLRLAPLLPVTHRFTVRCLSQAARHC